MIATFLRQLVGLFVDDQLLAATIVVIVAAATLLARATAAPAWVAGLVLALALPAALAASVALGARRKTRGG